MIAVAIVGPSGSGKTTIARKLVEKLGDYNSIFVSLDQYYKDWSAISIKKRDRINFDHPGSFDFRLLGKHLEELGSGKAVKAPVYCYKTHCRLSNHHALPPKRYIIVEGLLVLHKKSIRDLFDISIFIKADKATSLSRRIKRDIKHRGESIESVCEKYFDFVLPMQERYVLPQIKYADIVIDAREPINQCAKKIFNYLKTQNVHTKNG